MRILIVGADAKGSFEMRGRQLGNAIGARVTMQPSARDWAWADVIVLVKRAVMAFGLQAKRARVPVIWDVLDFWKQPQENGIDLDVLKQRVTDECAAIGITTVIGATQAMATDLHGVYLPHHCLSGLEAMPPRLDPNRTIVVGYHGRAKYLGAWKQRLEQACENLGMAFVINPVDLRELDVVVALRDGQWDGEVCRRWKSGVKYVNALVAGLPVLAHATSAFDEVGPVGAIVERPETIEERLVTVSSSTNRADAYDLARRRAHEFSLFSVARRYREIIQSTVRAAA